MSYDTECENLAWYFLNGTRATESDIAALAQCIQSTIEDWLTDFEDNLEPRPSGPVEEDGYPGSLLPRQRGTP